MEKLKKILLKHLHAAAPDHYKKDKDSIEWIESLDFYNASLKAMQEVEPKWISVTELPKDDNQLVLFVQLSDGVIIQSWAGLPGGRTLKTSGRELKSGYTHWMPLPKTI